LILSENVDIKDKIKDINDYEIKLNFNETVKNQPITDVLFTTWKSNNCFFQSVFNLFYYNLLYHIEDFYIDNTDLKNKYVNEFFNIVKDLIENKNNNCKKILKIYENIESNYKFGDFHIIFGPLNELLKSKSFAKLTKFEFKIDNLDHVLRNITFGSQKISIFEKINQKIKKSTKIKIIKNK